MKTYYIERLSPTKIAIADVSPYGEGEYIITRINVPQEYRGRGIGSRLLQQIIEEADRENIRLYLEIAESDGLSHKELQKWYERHGFRGFLIFMREPRSTL